MKRGILGTVALALAFGLTMGSVTFYGGDAWAQALTAGPALRLGGFNDDGRGAKIRRASRHHAVRRLAVQRHRGRRWQHDRLPYGQR